MGLFYNGIWDPNLRFSDCSAMVLSFCIWANKSSFQGAQQYKKTKEEFAKAVQEVEQKFV